MRNTNTQVKYLRDYTAPAFLVERTELHFDIRDGETLVTAELSLRRNDAGAQQPLTLDGDDLTLLDLAVDGQPWPDHEVGDSGLVVNGLPDECMLRTRVRIRPEQNTALEGLYRCGPYLVTQCEATGFRRITYYPDRPDVLSRFRVTIEADRERYPTLLSNGNCVATDDLDDGRHQATWDDPYPKPCYLFALVAGEFEELHGDYTTASGRRVSLELYADKGQGKRLEFALESLIESMRWDELHYGREYDLDRYLIVAAAAFNMGAMENKGLNIFNTSCLLADPDTATDAGYRVVRDVIAHEYFHNWTGNRITCRDWFQLSLKEGLTVFREQQFSETVNDPAVARVEQVRGLRAFQFPEDAGPMAHPVRPESYVEMNNFYTATVYEKGSEVIRMMRTLVGEAGFRKGMDVYFERHDGQAVTIEDFVAAIEAGSGADLSAFRIWYSQAGTPSLQLRDQWDGTTGTYRLTLTQHMAPTRGQPDKHPAPIPVSLALFDRHGASVDASPDTPLLESAHNVFVLDRPEAEMLWTGLSERPVLSALRGFSAPVRLHFDQPDTDLALLMRAESDAFSRWEAGQRLLHAAFSDYVQGDDARGRARLTSFCEAVAATDPSEPIVGEWLDLPATVEFTDALGAVDVDAALVADRCVRQGVADGLAEQLIAWYDAIETASPYRFDAEQAHLRRRRGACLRLMSLIDAAGAAARAETLLASADNLTDRLAALAAVNDLDDPVRAELFARFADDWGTEPLAMDKWFQLQATSVIQGQPAGIRELAARDDYDRGVPNRVRALFGSFGQRQFDGFHRMDGEGYRLLADEVLAMDALNPQVAARIVRPLTQVARILGDRSELMRRELTRIAESESLSADVREIVSAAL